MTSEGSSRLQVINLQNYLEIDMTAVFLPRVFIWLFNSSFPALAVVDYFLSHLCCLTNLAMMK